MSGTTKIAWCDHTFNPWIGCTKVSPGCDHCYAEVQDSRMRWEGKKHWGAGVPRYRTSLSNWAQPLAWNRKAAKDGRPHRVFCASLADFADSKVPELWRTDLENLIARTRALSWLLVTKRIGNVAKLYPRWIENGFPDNVRILITICNQEEADRDIPKLLALRCRNGISYEPALGLIDWTKWLGGEYNPIYEDHSNGTRRANISGGSFGRTRDRLDGPDMAAEETSLEQVETANDFLSVSARKGGERHRRLSPNSSDGGQTSRSHNSAPACVSTLLWADTAKPDSEPQGREKETKRAEQFGVGNLHGTTDSCTPRIEGGADRSKRNEERDGETDTASSQINQAAPRQGRAITVNSSGFRHQISDCIEDRPRRSLGKLSWLIIGGESGPKARPFDLAWARSTIEQCKAARVSVFCKQLGACPKETLHGHWRDVALKDRAGADPSEWPADLNVREFPV
jgi:protein gp37